MNPKIVLVFCLQSFKYKTFSIILKLEKELTENITLIDK